MIGVPSPRFSEILKSRFGASMTKTESFGFWPGFAFAVIVKVLVRPTALPSTGISPCAILVLLSSLRFKKAIELIAEVRNIRSRQVTFVVFGTPLLFQF